MICDPITEHQNAEQFHQQRDAERKIDLSTYETGAMVVVGATTPTERSPLLVPNAKTNEELPDWAAFLTSTPMQKQLLRQPASSSASSSTTASQDALHSLNVSRTRQLFALSPMRAHPISSTEISNGMPFKKIFLKLNITIIYFFKYHVKILFRSSWTSSTS